MTFLSWNHPQKKQTEFLLSLFVNWPICPTVVTAVIFLLLFYCLVFTFIIRSRYCCTHYCTTTINPKTFFPAFSDLITLNWTEHSIFFLPSINKLGKVCTRTSYFLHLLWSTTNNSIGFSFIPYVPVCSLLSYLYTTSALLVPPGQIINTWAYIIHSIFLQLTYTNYKLIAKNI